MNCSLTDNYQEICNLIRMDICYNYYFLFRTDYTITENPKIKKAFLVKYLKNITLYGDRYELYELFLQDGEYLLFMSSFLSTEERRSFRRLRDFDSFVS